MTPQWGVRAANGVCPQAKSNPTACTIRSVLPDGITGIGAACGDPWRAFAGLHRRGTGFRAWGDPGEQLQGMRFSPPVAKPKVSGMPPASLIRRRTAGGRGCASGRRSLAAIPNPHAAV